jgi:hypothetical protein
MPDRSSLKLALPEFVWMGNSDSRERSAGWKLSTRSARSGTRKARGRESLCVNCHPAVRSPSLRGARPDTLTGCKTSICTPRASNGRTQPRPSRRRTITGVGSCGWRLSNSASGWNGACPPSPTAGVEPRAVLRHENPCRTQGRLAPLVPAPLRGSPARSRGMLRWTPR